MPETLRMKEDLERAQKSRDEKKKGQQGKAILSFFFFRINSNLNSFHTFPVFLQKYHHKGAFYTDSEILKKHDYSEPAASTNRNIESLPAAMQVRNFGKRAQTKYTHLAKEDTTNEGRGASVKRAGGGYGEKLGGDERSGGGGNACYSCGKEGHVRQTYPILESFLPDSLQFHVAKERLS